MAVITLADVLKKVLACTERVKNLEIKVENLSKNISKKEETGRSSITRSSTGTSSKKSK